MNKSIFVIIVVLIIIGIVVGVYYFVKPTEIGGIIPHCSWVFKTRGNYSNLVHVWLNQNKNEVMSYSSDNNIKKLAQSYYTFFGSCTYSHEMNIAFTSITWDEWKLSQEDCNRQMKEKTEQLRIQKCGSLDFDIFEECNNFTSPGERICHITPPPKNVTNPTKCTYDITLEENIWRSSCEMLSADDFLKNVIDDDPLIELYLCNLTEVPFVELNLTINNGELDIKCEKII